MWGAVTNQGQCTAALQPLQTLRLQSNVNCRGFNTRSQSEDQLNIDRYLTKKH